MSKEYIRTKSDQQFIDDGGLFLPEYGDKIISFLEKYVRSPQGQPFIVMPWVRDVIHSWFSWRNEDLSRRVQVGVLSIARQNGKSFLIAGLHLYTLLHQNGARCLNVATNRDQASQVYDYIDASIRWNIDNGDGKLSCLRTVKSSNEVYYDAGNSRFISAPCNSKALFGKPQSFVSLDEMSHYVNDSENLWRALKDSTVATSGLKVVISSAGFNVNSKFYNMVQDSKKIISGDLIDVTWMPWIYETIGDYDQPGNWTKANPSLNFCGQSIEQFKLDWETAKRDPSEKFNFIRLRFNNWTSTSGATWIPVEDWEACQGEYPDLEDCESHLGIDFAHASDFCSMCLCIKKDEKVYTKFWSWIPQKATEREKQNIGIYAALSRSGCLTVVKGDAVGVEADLLPTLNLILASHNVKTITIDKWQLHQLSEQLMNRGYKVFECSQNPTQVNAPINDIMRAVQDRRLVQDGDASVRWQIGHCELERNNRGYCSITKPFAHLKIDSLDALVFAWSQVMLKEEELEIDISAFSTFDW
jgi:phage terminase large subunit-like protein